MFTNINGYVSEVERVKLNMYLVKFPWKININPLTITLFVCIKMMGMVQISLQNQLSFLFQLCTLYISQLGLP